MCVTLSFLCVWGDGMNVRSVYQCHLCGYEYFKREDAQMCCECQERYKCLCGITYPTFEQANDCCQEKPIDEEKEPFDFISFGD